MTSISDISGLPVVYDEEKQYFMLGEELHCPTCKEVTLGELSPALLNKSLKYPEFVYIYHERLIRKEDLDKWNENLSYDLYALPYGLLGIEYNKTHIYYTEFIPGKAACIVEVLMGELTIILQKNKQREMWDFDAKVDDVRIIRVRLGEKITIPTGYMFTFVNPTGLDVVFSLIKSKNLVIDYSMLSREQGLAYFFIAKNAKAEVVTNPRYRVAPEVEYSDGKDIVEIDVSFLNANPLYQVALKATEKLLDLLY